MLKQLVGLDSFGDKAVDLELTAEPHRLGKPVRIFDNGRAVELELGRQTLRLYPAFGLSSGEDPEHRDWILVDPDRYFSEIAGFLRLKPGEAAIIGRGDEIQDAIFRFPKSVAKRHVALKNENGRIVAVPLDNEASTSISCVDDPDEYRRLDTDRLKRLKRLRKILGGPIELPSKSEANETIDRVVEILRDEACRPKNSYGQPGGMLELPGKPTPVIVGDLHAQIDNLLTVLISGGTLDALRRGDAYLLLLGDTVHRESEDELADMDSSLLMLDLVFKLKIRFPANVFYLRGNHESFDEEIGKSGVPQAQLLQAHARELYGKNFARQLAEVFELLPYVALSDDFIACHAGPPRRKVSRQRLIDIRDYPKLAREVRWNRIERPNRPEGYSKGDIRALRARLGAEKHTPVIVSHTRLSQTETVWTDVGSIKNHHIVFTSNTDELGVFIRVHRTMVPLTYPVEPLLDLANGLD